MQDIGNWSQNCSSDMDDEMKENLMDMVKNEDFTNSFINNDVLPPGKFNIEF